MKRSPDSRFAFTLVEVLVVIALLGLLMALLLPAIQNAREGSRRSECTAHLAKLGLAAIRFDDGSRFAPGWRNQHPSGGASAVSWPVVLLPFLGRNDIYNSWQAGSNAGVPISFFICPSSPPPSQTLPYVSYAGNAGSGSSLEAVYINPNNDPRNKWDGVMTDTLTGPSGRIGFREVAQADGTVNTILITEKCGRGDPSGAGGPVRQARWDILPSAGEGSCFANFYPIVPAIGITSPTSDHNDFRIIGKIVNNEVAGINGNGAPGYRSQPSSRHGGGVVAVFCDGHTVFLKDSIRKEVYAQLLSSDHTRASVASRGVSPFTQTTNTGLRRWNAGLFPYLKEVDYK